MKRKKIILLVLTFLLIFLFIKFNKIVISNFILSKLSKWTERKVIAESVDINYSKKLISFNNLEILNKPNFYNKNIFEVKKLTVEIELLSLFSDLVIINKFVLVEPKFFFEIKDMSEKLEDKVKITKDNIGLIDKIIKQASPKIYPPKKKDKNFLIIDLNIKNSKAFIRHPSSTKTLIINLSNMSLPNIGNADPKKEKNTQQFKDALRLILGDIFFRIPDMKLRKFLKEKYKIK